MFSLFLANLVAFLRLFLLHSAEHQFHGEPGRNLRPGRSVGWRKKFLYCSARAFLRTDHGQDHARQCSRCHVRSFVLPQSGKFFDSIFFNVTKNSCILSLAGASGPGTCVVRKVYPGQHRLWVDGGGGHRRGCGPGGQTGQCSPVYRSSGQGLPNRRGRTGNANFGCNGKPESIHLIVIFSPKWNRRSETTGRHRESYCTQAKSFTFGRGHECAGCRIGALG